MGVISEHDYQVLVRDFNATDDASLLGHTVDRLFETIVEEHGSNVALIHDDAQLTYQQLNASANLLARCLSKRGVGHGDIVGLAVDRSVDLIVALVAILKVGAAYVPVDPSFPAERISQMLEDAAPRLILTTGAPTAGLARWASTCLSMGEARDGAITDASNLRTRIRPGDLAYIIYTSGSTGRPKGVEVGHGAAANFLASLRRREPGCAPHDRLLAITTVSFDMSVLELLLPLISGATMVLAHSTAVRDPQEVIRLMALHAVTVMQATPATWGMLLEAGWQGHPRLSKVLCGGEAFPRRLADRLLAKADSVWNVYGPSETTYGSVGRVGRDGEVVAGYPVANGRIYVLNDDLSPAPMGQSGEVYIGGGSVSQGYRNKPELTRARFLKNPFHGGLFFRTGDMARFVGPGQLQVLGRIDGMVKVRGFRVEVGDIEAAIVAHEAFSEAVVVSHDDRLAAYCVWKARADGADRPDLGAMLRPWLAERLPAYMVPALFVGMDALPLSPNQKVDRKALPDPVTAIKFTTAVPPATDMERQVHGIWSSVLGHDGFGVEDSFFRIGGDSVRLIRVQAQLEKLLGRRVTVPKLFEHYTIRALAAHVAAGENDTDTCFNRRSTMAAGDKHGEAIAVISMACRLPGGVSDPEAFWDLLRKGGDAISDVPKDRWDAGAIYDADPDAPGKSYCSQGGFIDSAGQFDAPFFGIAPKEAQEMDPVQALVLETGWEAFERAGYTKEQLRGSETGVFMGVSNNVTTAAGPPPLDGYSITGSAAAVSSGRLSYVLGLEGPSMTVDTACSSSLVAAHLACNALRLGECDLALAGGASLLLGSGIHVEFSRLRGLATDGRCRAFSADAEGTGFSDGCAMVVLKRLSDAQRDGDLVHAVLRGTATAHGGRSASLTAPNAPSQARLIRDALMRSSVAPGAIDYIEAHGTATRLGDPIEGAALADVFGGSHSDARPLWVGSSKSNIGHTGAAAGIAGMIKVILALTHGMLPRTLHVSTPTPAVDWARAPMALLTEAQAWPAGDRGCRRAGVSSFGIGGTGAHIVVEEAPPPPAGPSTPAVPPPTLLFPLSGPTEAVLRTQASKLLHHLERVGSRTALEDVAYSLAVTRHHFSRRLVLCAADSRALADQLAAAAAGALTAEAAPAQPGVAMLFTGQGSQYLGMGQRLYNTLPQFRAALDRVANHFAGLEPPLLAVMWAAAGSHEASLLSRTDYGQPAVFAVQAALWELWRSWGVRPAAVLGHSVGEFAAAYAAGALDLAGACTLVAARGRLMQALPAGGVMVVLEAPAGEVEAAVTALGLRGRLALAGLNTPCQTVVSGLADAADALVCYFAIRGGRAKRLAVSHAFHSEQMRPMLAEFGAVLASVRFHAPATVVVSGCTGKRVEPGQLEDPGYWMRHAVEAVRFRDAMDTMASLGLDTFLELGPQPVLLGMGATCFAQAAEQPPHSVVWLPSLVPGKDDATVLHRSLAALHVRNVPVDWPAYYRQFRGRRVELPTYAFRNGAPARLPNHEALKSDTEACAPLGPSRPSVDCFKYDVEWCQATINQVASGHLWGLFCPAGEPAWATLLAGALAAAGIQLRRVGGLQDAASFHGLVCVWDSDGDVLAQAHAITAQALAQLQAVIGLASVPKLVWVTRRAVGAGPAEPVLSPGVSPLLGLLRTARTEYPDLPLRLIDLDDASVSGEAVARALSLDDPECLVQRNRVLVSRLRRLEAPVSPPAKRAWVQPNGAVLVTGALGDIGQHVTRWLVTAHAVTHLVLVSRRGMNTRGAGDFVDELVRLGASDVRVVAADVGDEKSVQAAMAVFGRERPLRGIVHTAGTLDDGTLSSLTAQRCSSVYRAKVNGAWHLHHLSRGMEMDFFILCSSLAGIIGNAGQANYAAANTFLDALAHMRRAQGLPATSVSLGLWGGNGMRAKLSASDQARYADIGIDVLDPVDGLQLLQDLAAEGRAHSLAVAFDLAKLKAHYEASGGIPSIWKSLMGAESDAVPVTAPAPVAMLGLLSTCSTAGKSHNASLMLDLVSKEIAKVLGFSSANEVDVTRPLQDLGVDSLTAILTRNRLSSLTGLKLSARIVFEHANIKALSQFLLSQVYESLAPASYGTSDPATPSAIPEPSGPLVVNEGCLDPNITFDSVTVAPQATAVFVTGGTGFVGAYIVGSLLHRGIHVRCLVRATSEKVARERMVSTLDCYGLWARTYEPLLATIVGDVALPLFGLKETVFDRLAGEIDAVCHSAALVDWMQPLGNYMGANVVSAQEVLRLASRGRGVVVHHISTAAVLPRYLGHSVSETEGEYGYSTSKWMAEQMVMAARWRGAKAYIYRLPYVTAASTGHFRLDKGDFLHNLVAGSVGLGCFPSIETDLSLVLPVDYLARSVVSVIAQDFHCIGQDFTFGDTNAPDFHHYFKTLAPGLSIVPFMSWKKQALDFATRCPDSPLAQIAAVLDGHYTDDDMVAMFKCPPVARHLFVDALFPVPTLDKESARRYLDKIIQRGTRMKMAATPPSNSKQ